MNLGNKDKSYQIVGYSEFSSAWYALVYGPGEARERLTNALTRAVHAPATGLTAEQQNLFRLLKPDKLKDRSSEQMRDLVSSLNETKFHELVETIAKLYFITVNPGNA